MKDNGGWVKLYRKTLKNPVIMKDAAHLAVWCYLLMSVSHNDYDVLFGGKRITLHPGQMTTTSTQIATALGLSASNVKRILNDFKNEKQLELRGERYGSFISVENWDKYQSEWTTGEPPFEPPVEPPANHQLNHEQNSKSVENKGFSGNCITSVEPPPEPKNEPPVNHQLVSNQEYIYQDNNILSIRAREDLKPSLDDVRYFVSWRGLKIDPDVFWHYYEARGWKINGQPVENWRAQAVIWNQRDMKKRKTQSYSQTNKFNQIERHDYDFDDLEKRLLGE